MKHLVSLLIALCAGLVASRAQKPLNWELWKDLAETRINGQLVKVAPDRAIYFGGWRFAPFRGGSRVVEEISVAGDVPTLKRLVDIPLGLAEMPAVSIDDTLIVLPGGFDENTNVSRNVYGYFPQTNTWKLLGQMNVGRRQHAAVALNDSLVLIVGGRLQDLNTMASAEIFNIRTGRSRSVSSYPSPVNGALFGYMSNGRPVICAGRAGGPNSDRIPQIYTFDVANERWQVIGALVAGLEAPFATSLSDGRFVIVGGSIGENPLRFIGDVTAERSGTFARVATMPVGLVHGAVSQRGEERIFAVGGFTDAGNSSDRCFFINVASGEVTEGPKLNRARGYVRSVTLASSTGKLYTFAVGGMLNGEAQQRIEMLRSDDCQTGKTSIALPLMKVSGDAIATDSIVRLTTANQNVAGAAWVRERVQVSKGFDIKFSFRMRDGNDNGQIDLGSPGADGIVLYLQNRFPTVLGRSGSGIGYDEGASGLAVEFDAYLNPEYSDPNGSHIAVQAGDGVRTRAWHVKPFLKGLATAGVPSFVADGSTYYCRVRLAGTTLAVFCGKGALPTTPLLEVPDVSISEILSLTSDGAAYLGFTSSTGRSAQVHELLSVEIEGCQGIVSSVSDEALMDTELNVSPNPASDLIRVSAVIPTEHQRNVRVIDTRGNVVAEVELMSNQTEVSIPTVGIMSGFYTVIIHGPEGATSRPLLIVR